MPHRFAPHYRTSLTFHNSNRIDFSGSEPPTQRTTEIEENELLLDAVNSFDLSNDLDIKNISHNNSLDNFRESPTKVDSKSRRSHLDLVAYAPTKPALKPNLNGSSQPENPLQSTLMYDGFTYVTLLLAEADTFPQGYVNARAYEARAGKQLGETIRFQTEIKLGPHAYRGFVALVNRTIRSGRSTAITYRLTSQQAIEERCKLDSYFQNRYNDNIAFWEGINSILWLAHKNPQGFEAYAARLASQRLE